MGFGIKNMKSTVLAAVFGVALSNGAFAAPCDEGSLNLRGDWGQAKFSVEIADDPAERAQGLMFRESMARNAGMLFVYDNPQSVSFWMQNTLIGLDILFIDQAGVVQRIHENAIPLDTTSIPGGDDVQYVLEINGGMSAMLGITVGTQVLSPAIDQNNAAWACTAE